jgi:hypothetical protein
LGFFADTVCGACGWPLALESVSSMAKAPFEDVGGEGEARVGATGDVAFASMDEC